MKATLFIVIVHFYGWIQPQMLFVPTLKQACGIKLLINPHDGEVEIKQIVATIGYTSGVIGYKGYPIEDKACGVDEKRQDKFEDMANQAALDTDKKLCQELKEKRDGHTAVGSDFVKLLYDLLKCERFAKP